MATIINKYIYGGGVVRTMIFIPYIASVVAVCTVWMVLLQPSYGPVNEFFRSIGIANPPGWLADFKWSLPSIMIIYVDPSVLFIDSAADFPYNLLPYNYGYHRFLQGIRSDQCTDPGRSWKLQLRYGLLCIPHCFRLL